MHEGVPALPANNNLIGPSTHFTAKYNSKRKSIMLIITLSNNDNEVK